MKLIKHRVFFLLILSIITLSSTVNASLISIDFAWEGDAGYRAEGVLTFDNAYPIVHAKGSYYIGGPANTGIQYLEISFFGASNTFLSRAVNVDNYLVKYNYLLVEFDTVNRNFTGILDMGEDDTLLSDNNLIAYNLLVNFTTDNSEHRGSWLGKAEYDPDNPDDPIYTTPDESADPVISVPEPGVISLMLLGLAGIAYQTRYRNKTLDKA